MGSVSHFFKFAGLLLVSGAVTVGCAQLLGLKQDVPPTPCVLNSDCSPSELCIFRVCSAACKVDKDCLAGSRCLDTDGSAACVAAQTATCSADADGGAAACPDGTVCDANGACRNSCASCHDDQTCVSDVCLGSDPNHDPQTAGPSGSGGADGTSGSSASTGGSVGNGGHAGSGGRGSTSGGSGPVGDAGSPGVVTCGDTAVGEKAPCSEKPDGTAINFPGARAQGPCAVGSKLCGSDGSFGPCVGAVAPAAADCTSTADNDCDGKADDSECGLCTAGATQYCYDGVVGTAGVGSCKSGTQVCQLDATKTATVWGPCAGEITPAPNDTCDANNDATCNNQVNEGCTCINGDTGTCRDKLQAAGNCGAGSTRCSGGNWSACSIAPKGSDTCDPNDDATCNGKINEGCGCTNGDAVSCGVSGSGCTLGSNTCQGGAYPGCVGNVCQAFDVTPPTAKCTATGPKLEDTDTACTIAVCPAGYHVSDCALTPSTGAVCSFNGANSFDGTKADVDTEKLPQVGAASCSFSSCSCQHDGF